MKRIPPILGLLVMCSGIALGQDASSSRPEQLSFEIGHRRPVVKHPVPLSDADLAVLIKATPSQQDVSRLMADKPALTPSIPKLAREGLEAALEHLNGPAERDLVIIGSGRRYTKMDIAPFWVIRERPDGPILVLAVWTHEFRILETKHRGMADVGAWRNTGMGTSVTSFDFNGFKYLELMESVN